MPNPLSPKRLLLPLLLASQIGISQPGLADSTAGAYLAARHADMSRSFPEVVDYGIRTLAEEPENIDILEGVVVAKIALGQVGESLPFARRLSALSADNQIAGLVMLGDALARDGWAEATALLDGTISIAPMVDEMIRAWASIGQGKMSDALKIFDQLTQDENSKGFALYQKALALAHVGDFENAAQILGGSEGVLHLNRGGLFSRAQILSRLERHDEATEVITAALNGMSDAETDQLLADLEAGKELEFTAVRTPRDGVAELLYAVAESLAPDADATVVLLYNRIAEHLNPNHEGAMLLSAQLFEKMEHYDLAIDAFGRVPKSSFAYQHAALGRTDVLRRADRLDEATGELRTLADTYPDTLRFRVSLGDTLMQQDRYEEARGAYDQAIGQFQADLPGQWATYFQRAIAAHKLNDWPAAEADFRKSLTLSPDEPNVLNYLGYSLVERREKMDEALAMIERAVAARPNSGFIVDSLGWALFRLGKYEEAVSHLERAVELMPVDPILNDHLGDSYWAVGRAREAEFQWSRALSFITDDTDLTEMNPDRVRRKIEVGLDVVLDEEGAAPLHGGE
ncbi:tetratricopeptide repeat protein [Aliiroseovarius marinus]|uniref:tetratricopeptide repeat protein n=1 Tax=Aliiroseovarius marinus TaxID=2500159 RepID=UPI003D7E1111